MNEILEKIKVEMNPTEINEEGNIYQIKIQIPTELGWIEDVKFVLDFDYPKEEFNMNFIKEENGLALFQSNVYLKTRAIYHYYFTSKIHGNQIYLKNKNKEDLNNISIDETFKTSVNFDIPNWAKGGIMYHIFLDRFNRGSKNLMEEKPRRKIHKSCIHREFSLCKRSPASGYSV